MNGKIPCNPGRAGVRGLFGPASLPGPSQTLTEAAGPHGAPERCCYNREELSSLKVK